jgi:RNA-directed DNA polymerase
MYTPIPPKSSLSTLQLNALAQRFEALRDVPGLAKLLGISEAALLKAAAKQEYLSFYVPKPGGERRLIQHPAAALKAIQQNLNNFLQAVYHGIRPAGAYGFILSAADELQPRNIYFNAMQHIKSEWFLLVDLKDFFHTVTKTHLKNLFRHLFFFPPDLTAVLTDLCTCHGRLPMGAPTSPVLSNFACLGLDHQMEALALAHHAAYTRYADDITFSFTGPPPDDFLDQVRAIVLFQGFVINEKKLRLQSRVEQPEITGLVVGKGPKPLPSKQWLKTLKQEIKVYHWLMSETVRERGLFHAFVFDRFKKSVLGQIEFLGFVLGKGHKEYRKLAGKVRWG